MYNTQEMLIADLYGGGVPRREFGNYKHNIQLHYHDIVLIRS